MEPVHRKGECGGVRTGVNMGIFLKPDIAAWLRTVTEQVAFKPDRAAIERELQDHYNDHVDALLAQGIPTEEAEKAALAAMGDAGEVGKAMNRVHCYWLGMLWKLSQLLLVLCVLLLIAALTIEFTRNDGPVFTLAERVRADLTYEEPPSWASRQDIPGGTIYLAASEDRTPDESGRPCYHATLWLEGNLLENRQHEFFKHLQMEDQTGSLSPYRSKSILTQVSENEFAYIAYEPWTGFFRQKFDLRLRVDHPPEYLTITQPYGESPWSIRCDWRTTE